MPFSIDKIAVHRQRYHHTNEKTPLRDDKDAALV